MRLWVCLIFACLLAISPATAEDFGAFKGELIYKAVEGEERIVQTVTPFAFEDRSGKLWSVPVGAKVDGASIPRAFWSVIGAPFTGKYREASVVHDHFCKVQTESWQDTHRIFYEGMRANGVDAVTANTMYAAVYWRGPRWINIATQDGAPKRVAGRPAPVRKPEIDITTLASKDGITLEEIRRSIDSALEIRSAYRADRVLSKQPDCSVVVEPLKADKAPFALCNLDVDNRRILARRNLQILLTDINTLLSANDTLLIPQVDKFIEHGFPSDWELVRTASARVMNIVTLTMLSLNQYRQGMTDLGYRMQDATFDPQAYRKSVERVSRIGTSRSMLLRQNITEIPRRQNEMRSWKMVYLELLRRLRAELPELEKGLR